MSSFTCDQCKGQISEGNIMVDGHDWSHESEVNAIEVWCKPCTRTLDERGGHVTLHNVYELSSVREAPFSILAGTFDDMLGEPPVGRKWSRAAIRRLLRLCAAAHPELAAGAYLDGDDAL
jgi:hypothetical protein